MSEQLFYAMAIGGLMLVASISIKPPATNGTAQLPPAESAAATDAGAAPAAKDADVATKDVPEPEVLGATTNAPAASDAATALEGGASGGPDEDVVVPAIEERTAVTASAIQGCRDACGDGRCQEAPCNGAACACQEGPLACPDDCAEKPGTGATSR